MRSGNRTQDLLHEGRALTDCAILASINTYYYYYYNYYYYYHWQMQALFASTTSFKVKRATSDLLGLSNKDLLVIPLSILTEILTSQRLFVMWYASLWMNFFKKLDLFLSVFFRRTGSNYFLGPRNSTNLYDDSLYGRSTPLDTLPSMTSRMDSVWETRREGRNL